MYNTILFFVIFLVLFGIFKFKILKSTDLSEHVLSTFLSLFVSFFITSIYLIICFSIIQAHPEIDHYVDDTKSIISIRNSNSMSGSFFLGSGSFNSEEYYVCYYKNTNNGIKQFRSKVDSSIIFEDTDKDPFVEIYRNKYDVGWFKYISVLNPVYVNDFSHIEYHVPKNTVVCNFKVE